MITSGPERAPIMIVGEAPGENEIIEKKPFVGVSGNELTRMLGEAGISRNDCFLCNVTDYRPPKNDINEFFFTKTEGKQRGFTPLAGRYPGPEIREGLANLNSAIKRVNPKLIICLGGTGLWGLTGKLGITKWRGSQLQWDKEPISLIPTFHPAAVLRDWSIRPETLVDLRRAARVLREGNQKPGWRFVIRPTFADVQEAHRNLRTCLEDGVPIVCDIETRGGQISCIGLSSDRLAAICIPLMCVERPEGYWSENEEIAVGEILRDILTHPKANIVFQNGAFDLQYFAKQMGFLPKCHNDTMLMQHTLFPGLKKALDYLASLYCHYYVYWKDDGKFWLKDIPEDEQWYYNCEDCVYTYECFEVLDGLIDRMKMRDQYSFQMELFHVAVEMMMRGIRVDLGRKAQVARDLERVKDQTQKWVNTAVGYPINMDSPKQMQELFYHEFMVPPVKNRQTGNPTTDDEALKTIARRQPLLKPLTDKVAEYRSLRVFKSNFADATVSEDNRARCSINLAGAETFRFSASADAFGDGCNMQTLPKGTEDD